MKASPAFHLLMLGWLLLSACTDGVLAYHYEPVSDEGWLRGDTLSFTLPPAPRTGDYVVSVGMRYASSFPYEGLWLVAETQLRHPHVQRIDTLYFTMSDPVGTPLGHGVSLQQRQMPIFRLRLGRGQSGTLQLRHIMAREVMPDIREVGILTVADEAVTSGVDAQENEE